MQLWLAFAELERADKHSSAAWGVEGGGEVLHSPTMKNPGAKHTRVKQATWSPSVENKSGGEKIMERRIYNTGLQSHSPEFSEKSLKIFFFFSQ